MKTPLTDKEEVEFFYNLGSRLYATAMRAKILGHKNVNSTVVDYLDPRSLQGMDREACEFLIDVALNTQSRSRERLSVEQLFEKWSQAATWYPSLEVAPANGAPGTRDAEQP